MRRTIVVLILSIFIVSSIPLSSTSYSTQPPLTVVVTTPDQVYNIGDVVHVQIHVFRAGDRFDPDSIELFVWGEGRSNAIDRTSTGLYKAEVEIFESELDNLGNLLLKVTVAKNGPYPETAAFDCLLNIREAPEFQVIMHLINPNDAYIHVGKMVEFQAMCFYGDELVDPDSGEMHAVVEQDENGNYTERVNMTRVSKGIYKGHWTVDIDPNVSVMYSIRARASFAGGGSDMGYLSFFYTNMDIWIHFIEVSTSSLDVDLYVMDTDGEPISGADVAMEFYYDRDRLPSQQLDLITASDGTVNIRLELGEDGPPPYEVTMKSEIRAGDLYHTEHWSVGTDPFFYRRGYSKKGFAVVLNNELPLPTGSEVSVGFVAIQDGEPLIHETVDCYLFTDHGILNASRVETDGEGNFKVNITTPEVSYEDDWYERIPSYFCIERGNTTLWNEITLSTSDYDIELEWAHQRSPETWLEIEETPSPFRYNVTLRSPGLDGVNERVSILWGTSPDYLNFNIVEPGWYPLNYPSYTIVVVENVSWDGQAYKGTLEIPNFLPPTLNISVRGVVENLDHPKEGPRWALVDNIERYLDNVPPGVEIQSPKDGVHVEDLLIITGVASDDVFVEYVLVRLDGGEWELANGTESWRLDIPEGRFPEGSHTIEAISFDGSTYSKVDIVEFGLSKRESRVTTPWPLILLVVIIVSTITGIYSWKSSSKKQDI